MRETKPRSRKDSETCLESAILSKKVISQKFFYVSFRRRRSLLAVLFECSECVLHAHSR